MLKDFHGPGSSSVWSTTCSLVALILLFHNELNPCSSTSRTVFASSSSSLTLRTSIKGMSVFKGKLEALSANLNRQTYQLIHCQWFVFLGTSIRRLTIHNRSSRNLQSGMFSFTKIKDENTANHYFRLHVLRFSKELFCYFSCLKYKNLNENRKCFF